MKKIAFFVEGLTEVLFIEKLLLSLFSKKRLAINVQKISGGATIPIRFETIKVDATSTHTEFYILIYNCTGETNVKSYIEARKSNLSTQGFSYIMGIRDVFPNYSFLEIPKLQYGLKQGIRPTPQNITIRYILSVMEIESCFLSEYTHFPKIHIALNSTLIKTNLGFDPSSDKMELLQSPANDLHNSYQLVGENYSKNPTAIYRTTSSLDYEEIYFNVRKRLSYIDEIISEVERILI